MEFSQLRCFLEVADTLHFTRAAERLHLSQPALSTQIDKLEIELGVELFERSRKQTTLTYPGTLYRAEAEKILALGARAVERARLAAAGKMGRLRIGFISTAAAYVIPPLIAEFHKQAPDVELELRHHLTAEQVDLLTSGALDIGFLRVPLREPSGLCTILVHKEPYQLFLPASHPLASKSKLALGDLDGADFVTYSKRNAPGYAATLADALQQSGIRPAATHEASDMYSLMSLVSAGVGIAIAPASLRNYRLPNVAIRDLSGIQPSEVALAHREGIDHPAALAFIRSARAKVDFRDDDIETG
ncbi:MULTISPECIES: LysR family transcriptional regulator [Rhodopseudomonas]|uniref:LysR family transcriptional regulator n=1 Tax=Rhodopseudomonas TaxID=1073 RepID=UPI0005C8A96F|nr:MULTISPECIES: LysR family transcriptional regulator [Rhodopseudomonas]MDF3812445.1 LysR family transcriptional regulator [Rhodopseudomonas sp. BAL398]WOK19444.1 LysR family transcriptional regulator [Rhodopseudomonas sp. BAL398]